MDEEVRDGKADKGARKEKVVKVKRGKYEKNEEGMERILGK